MDITVNGAPWQVAEACMIVDLLKEKRCKVNMTSVWLNGRQLLMAEYATTPLAPGDTVKLVRLFGGG